MVPIVTFIGWHDSGKTTLSSRVVHRLKEHGYRVAVIKSTKDRNIRFDTPDTDTYTHRNAGADCVLLVAPDQMVMMSDNRGESLFNLAHRYFPDADIVIGEGFKEARKVAKIEVYRQESGEGPLRDRVTGVIGIVSNDQVSGDYVFRLDEVDEITSFIEERFLGEKGKSTDRTTLLVNGERVVMIEFVQNMLAGVVKGFVSSLKLDEKKKKMKTIEIRINLSGN